MQENTVLSCHRCLITTGVEKSTVFKYILNFDRQRPESKRKFWYYYNWFGFLKRSASFASDNMNIHPKCFDIKREKSFTFFCCALINLDIISHFHICLMSELDCITVMPQYWMLNTKCNVKYTWHTHTHTYTHIYQNYVCVRVCVCECECMYIYSVLCQFDSFCCKQQAFQALFDVCG